MRTEEPLAFHYNTACLNLFQAGAPVRSGNEAGMDGTGATATAGQGRAGYGRGSGCGVGWRVMDGEVAAGIARWL